ncbi:hypothetical protein ACP275_12G076100 [Erythranthe tilingii]
MDKDHNLYTLLTSLYLCVFCNILLSKRSCGDAYYEYDTCVPGNCGSGGPNISFPFYIPGRQESFCGYPGFALNCSENGSPVLRLPDQNEYVVEDIFYTNQSLHVYNALVPRSVAGSSCLPRIRNTTLPQSQFDYASSTSSLRLFSNCTKPLPEELLRYSISCDGSEDGKYWELALYERNDDRDRNLTNIIAMEICQENVVTPVGLWNTNSNNEMVNLAEVLRKGFLLNWIAGNCRTCQESGGRCGFDDTSYHFRCYCPDRPRSRSCAPRVIKSSLRKIFLIGGLAITSLVVTSIILFLFVRRRHVHLKFQRFREPKPMNEKDIELFLQNNGNLAPTRYKYSDIKKMTKSFSESLGKGGYGSVYKGKVSDDGRLVAVKMLNESKGNGDEFMNEVASISRTSHVNVVILLGFCFEGSKRALIYEFMPNSSLEKFIQNTNSSLVGVVLGREKLLQIALGIARGLEYLHQGCNMRILHFDIKPHNILLDKDFNPKISDFGLAKLCPNRSSIVSMLVARGTIGYIAPEVFSRNFGEVSHKSDVYSYGMVILEIAGARKNIDPKEVDRSSEVYFPQYIYRQLEMEAENCGGNIVDEDEGQFSMKKLIIVGLWCVQTDPKDRPSMKKVLEMLEGNLEVLQVPPKPYISSPQRFALSFSASESI